MKPLQRTDEMLMRIALTEAQIAFDSGEVPVGAIIVLDGQVIAKAHNQVETLKDATAHAEILAITQASACIDDWRLADAVMYVTKEPCAMCAGALVNCRIAKAVVGTTDPRYGAAGSALNVTAFPGHLHQVEVVCGVLEDECRHLLQDFFRRTRKENRE